MARTSRKVRQKISAGVRRYWRQVRKVKREYGLPTLTTARHEWKRVKEIQERERISFTRALRGAPIGLVPPPAREWRSPNPEGEFAFNLRDRDRAENFRIYERFRDVEEVVGELQVWRHDPDGGRTLEREFDIRFPVGADESTFWYQYHAAIRATALKYIYETYSGQARGQFSILIIRLYVD